jgi:N-acylglucosamine-6-phosphate 2-epimerase
MIKKGIIISIQGYHYKTCSELAKEAINAGAIAIRTDKRLTLGDYDTRVPIIGLHKIEVIDPKKEAYITPNVENIKAVMEWCDYIAVDFRRCNKGLKEISNFAQCHKLKIIADIECIEDYENIKSNGFEYTYIATTLSVFQNLFHPDLRLIRKLKSLGEKNIIAEGNFSRRWEIKEAYKNGANSICIGSAVSNIYKLTKKYTSVETK